MSSLLKLGKDLEQKSLAQASDTEQMLKRVFTEHERSVSAALNSSVQTISDAIAAHTEGMNAALQSHRLNVLRMVWRTWLTISMVSVLLLCSLGGVLWYQGQRIATNLEIIRKQEQTQAMLSEKNNGVQLALCGPSKRRCVKVNENAGRFGENSDWIILAGK